MVRLYHNKSFLNAKLTLFFTVIFFCFFSVFSFFSFSAPSSIKSISFSGLIRNSSSDLLKKLTSKVGYPFDSVAVRQDITTLNDTGYFDDVKVSRNAVAGGVALVFNVHEKGIVSKVSFLGNKKIKVKDLKGVLVMRAFSPLDEGKIVQSEKAIEKLYLEKKLPLAEVFHELKPVENKSDEYELTFVIQENRKVKIRRVSFVGNKKFSDKALRKELKTREKGFLSFITSSGKYDEDQLKNDLEKLEFFYRNHGYIKVKISQPRVTLTRDRKALYVAFTIYEGDQYKVSLAGVSGDILTTAEELNSALKLKVNEVYSEMNVYLDRQMLENKYGDQGYADVVVSPDLRPHDETKTVDVFYNIDKGERIFIEKIIIKGNTVTHDKVIRREMQIQENALYNRSQIDVSKRRLQQLGYFEDVAISMPRASTNSTRNIVIEVKEKSTGTFNIGAGFSSLESFLFNASIEKDNFFGLGWRGSAMARLSGLRQEFSLSFTDRYFLDSRWIFSGSLYRYYSALNQDFDQDSAGGSATLGREVLPYFDANIGYQIEKIKISNFSAQVPEFFKEKSSGLTSSGLVTFAYDRRDNRLTTSKGSYHTLTNQLAGEMFGGDNNFWKVTGDTRYYFKLPLQTIFRVRGLGSYIDQVGSGSVPLFERLFLGGVNSLRGYDFNAVGPTLRIPSSAIGGDKTFTYGGNRSLMFNAELEVPIYAPAGFKAVTFLDSGQTYAETESIDLSRLRANYGFGLRWLSPFGPLRFEWGFPINRQTGESPSVFNFTIGQSF